jgi:hypothetical protein
MSPEEPSLAAHCPSGDLRFILAAGMLPAGHKPQPQPAVDDDDEDDDDDLRKPGSGEGNIDPDDDEGVGDDEDDEDDDEEDTLWTCMVPRARTACRCSDTGTEPAGSVDAPKDNDSGEGFDASSRFDGYVALSPRRCREIVASAGQPW